MNRCSIAGERLLTTNWIIGLPKIGISGLGSLNPAFENLEPAPAIGTTILSIINRLQTYIQTEK